MCRPYRKLVCYVYSETRQPAFWFEDADEHGPLCMFFPADMLPPGFRVGQHVWVRPAWDRYSLVRVLHDS